MYPFFYGHSQESPHWLFLAVVFVSDHVLSVPLPPHGEKDACSTSVYFCLSAFWLLLRLNCSLSNLLMSCKATCLPPQRASWGESGIPGISLPGSVSRVRRLILYINLNLVSYTPFPPPQGDQGCSFQTHPGIVWYTLSTFEEAEMPGIIDDEVGHVIYPCKTARTLSHLLLSGIVPPTPFRLIVKAHGWYLTDWRFLCFVNCMGFLEEKSGNILEIFDQNNVFMLPNMMVFVLCLCPSSLWTTFFVIVSECSGRVDWI